MLTSALVKEWAKECGADAVGIGDIQRFEGAPMQSDPRYIFPEAKSIIGFAFRVHRGLYRGIEEGTWFAGLPSMGYANINDVYAPIVLREVGNLLEDNGYEAILYQNTSVRLGSGIGTPVGPDMPKPDIFLHFRIAAYICGMGEIGWSKVFLTPEFGPRERFAFIITDAPLDPDEMMAPGTLCDRCKRCVGECPGNAISKDESVKVTVGGVELEWGRLEETKCAAVYQAGSPEYSPFMPEHMVEPMRKLIDAPSGKVREEMVDYTDNVWQWCRDNVRPIMAAHQSYHHPATICGARGCQRACFIHLEEQGKLTNKFKTPFRIRKPWKLDV